MCGLSDPVLPISERYIFFFPFYVVVHSNDYLMAPIEELVSTTQPRMQSLLTFASDSLPILSTTTSPTSEDQL
jgi:hypothetical protein